MGLPQLESCCCGCTLKTGTKIIGWLGVIGCILLMINGIFGIVYAETHDSDSTDKTVADALLILKISSWTIIIFSAICLFINVILLLGVHQEKPNFVKAYIIVVAISIILNIAFVLFAIVLGNHWIIFVRDIFGIVLQIYFFLVVNSYYNTMAGGERSFA